MFPLDFFRAGPSSLSQRDESEIAILNQFDSPNLDSPYFAISPQLVTKSEHGL